ncbi:MAG: aspartate carbamoyltransferase [Deltaproteobacteria bacterium]|nr:aspartate carbamoyltransferase [Deltaproteobacteria bacterium]
MAVYRPPEGRPVSPHLPFGERRDGAWYGKSIISVKQFSRDDLEYAFGVAKEMREMVARVGSFDLLKGKVLANLFYEASTRTASSFVAAMARLGGSTIQIHEVHYSSVSKGESLPDTIRTLECYADCIVLRHPQVGAAAQAVEVASKPILNAGDGIGEHPTQALLDLFTIESELGQIDGKTITMLGDLRFGRTVHSLSRLLAQYDVKLRYVAPDILQMPRDIVDELASLGVEQVPHDRLDDVLPETDVLYVTRVQKERFEDPADYENVRGAYVVDGETMLAAKEHMVVMHPLPRVGEIATEVDADPRAAYFRQMENGMYVRMALLAMVLGKA